MVPVREAQPKPRPRTPLSHELTEYAHGVGLLMSMDEKEPVGRLVESLSTALAHETKRRPHPLAFVNFGLIVPLIFSAGIFYARFGELETRVNQMRSTETVSAKVDNLQQQVDTMSNAVTRLTERLDRLMDRTRDRAVPNDR